MLWMLKALEMRYSVDGARMKDLLANMIKSNILSIQISSMFLTKLHFLADNETLSGQILTHQEGDYPRLLFLHGAGQSSKEKILPLAERLLEAGLASFSFDFSGHGESSGKSEQSSLKKRVAEAQAALNFLSPQRRVLCAFSMSGHVALELLKTNPFETLVLFCPAIYAPEAFEAPFDGRFTVIIRQNESWKRSQAVQALDDFTGKLLLFSGEKDEVIPKGVIELIEAHAQQAARKETVTLPGAGHFLIQAALQNPKIMDTYVEKIVEYSRPEQ